MRYQKARVLSHVYEFGGLDLWVKVQPPEYLTTSTLCPDGSLGFSKTADCFETNIVHGGKAVYVESALIELMSEGTDDPPVVEFLSLVSQL